MFYLLDAELPWYQTPLYAGIFAALIGAFVAWLTSYLMDRNNKTKAKKDLVFEFHREFNNAELSKNRRAANKLIIDYANQKGYDDLYDKKELIEELGKSSGDDILSLYAVMRFFQRLAIAHYNHYIDKDLLNALFQEFFYYWHYNVFVTLEDERKAEKGDAKNQAKVFSEWKTLYTDMERLAICFQKCIIKDTNKNNELIRLARERFKNYKEKNDSKTATLAGLAYGFLVIGNTFKKEITNYTGELGAEYSAFAGIFTTLSSTDTFETRKQLADKFLELAKKLDNLSEEEKNKRVK